MKPPKLTHARMHTHTPLSKFPYRFLDQAQSLSYNHNPTNLFSLLASCSSLL